MAKNIYIASMEPHTGKSIICLGLIHALRCMVGSVGYFKPIGQKYAKPEQFDKEALMIKEVFSLEDDIKDINPLSIHELSRYLSNDEHEASFEKIQDSYKKISANKDIVIIDGTDYLGMMNAFQLDINADIAINLNASIVLIEDGHNKSIDRIISDILAGQDSFTEQGCDFLGAIVNKLDPDNYKTLCTSLKETMDKHTIHFLGAVPLDPVLPKPRLSDIAQSLGAKILFGRDYLSNIATNTIITAMNIEHALHYISDGTLIITGGDRYDIILGAIASLVSSSYPKISGIILTGGIMPEKNISKLLSGLEQYSRPFTIPIMVVAENTIETANRISSLKVHVSSQDTEKIEISRTLIARHIDYQMINTQLNLPKSTKRTPDIFKYEIVEKAQAVRKRIVLPEGDEERTLKAIKRVRKMDLADIILLGNPDRIRNKAVTLGITIPSDIEIINPGTAPLFDDYATHYYELRKGKNIEMEIARDLMTDPIYFGTMMLQRGDADGLVSGAVHTTQHTIRPSFQIIKTKEGINSASSIFFMCLKDRVLVYGDCAVIPKPTAEELSDIAIASADTANTFDIEPRVALLSYSTGESGKGPEVERVREATKLARAKRPDLLIEGPIQYDAAVDPDVAKVKLPDSKVAGKASVLIFPDLNTGNNTYKAVQRSSGAIAIGPILQGLNKPVNDLSRGCLVEDIVYTIAITAIQAQQ